MCDRGLWGHPKGCQTFCAFGSGQRDGFWHPTLHFLKAAGSTLSCPGPGHCISLDRTPGCSRTKGSLLQELEKCPGRRDEILALHIEQGTFSSTVALGLAPARPCLSANAIRFKSLNYHPGNHWELFWRCKIKQGWKFPSRFGPARSAPRRKEPLVPRTVPCVQDSHSLGLCAGSLDFTRLEDIPPDPLGHTGSGWFGKQND